jgi:hypothetical protein
MMSWFIWLAQEEETLSIQELLNDVRIDFRHLALIGSILLVSLGVFVWAAFFRKPKRHRHRHPHRHPAPAPMTPPRERHRSGWRFFRKHHHRRRRKERPRNPTLAEVGGLPPVRTPVSPPTSS